MIEQNVVASFNVAAVVVTYCAPEALRRCLDAIAGQERPVDRVVVVDNDSSNEAALVLDGFSGRLDIELVCPGQNIGPAGGYSSALRLLLATHFDFAWLMDDDLEPRPSCLSELLQCAATRGEGVLVGPYLFERSTGERNPAWGWPGILIPRGYVDAAGVPRADLFWGLEDTEYVHFRPPRYGYHAILWPHAEAVINTKRSSRSIAGWKYYYLARNAVYLNLYDRPDVPLGSRLKRLTRGLRDLTRRLRNDPSERLAKCALFARGVWHGIVRRLGRTVVPTDADRPIE